MMTRAIRQSGLFLFFTSVVMGSAAWAVPICERSPAVRQYIEDFFHLPCDRLLPTDLIKLGSYRGGECKKDLVLEADSLKFGDFQGMSGINCLHLTYRGKSPLPDSAFKGLSLVTRVTLFASDQPSISPGLLDGLRSLRTLVAELGPGGISAGFFDGTPGITFVRMSLGLGGIARGAFSGLDLKELQITQSGGEQASQMQDFAFEGLKVQDLIVGGLSVLKQNTFGKMKEAISVRMGNTLNAKPIEVWEPGSFNQIPGLSSLWVYVDLDRVGELTEQHVKGLEIVHAPNYIHLVLSGSLDRLAPRLIQGLKGTPANLSLWTRSGPFPAWIESELSDTRECKNPLGRQLSCVRVDVGALTGSP